MREIKFRAYNSNVNKMVYDVFPTRVKLDNGYLHYMQFTGLTDKNGVEIYEGDIDERGLIEFRNGSFILVHNPTCMAEREGECPWDYLNKEVIELLSLEVIRNIYENKELLDD